MLRPAQTSGHIQRRHLFGFGSSCPTQERGLSSPPLTRARPPALAAVSAESSRPVQLGSSTAPGPRGSAVRAQRRSWSVRALPGSAPLHGTSRRPGARQGARKPTGTEARHCAVHGLARFDAAARLTNVVREQLAHAKLAAGRKPHNANAADRQNTLVRIIISRLLQTPHRRCLDVRSRTTFHRSARICARDRAHDFRRLHREVDAYESSNACGSGIGARQQRFAHPTQVAAGCRLRGASFPDRAWRAAVILRHAPVARALAASFRRAQDAGDGAAAGNRRVRARLRLLPGAAERRHATCAQRVRTRSAATSDEPMPCNVADGRPERDGVRRP